MQRFDQPYWTPKQDLEIQRLASDGWTLKQIALRMGSKPEAVAQRAKKLGMDLTSVLQNSWRQGAHPTNDRQ